ncbi:MEDS domain-containing protein [Candidatus Nitrospira bockiana]
MDGERYAAIGKVEQGEHLCSLYHSTEEMLNQVVPYLCAGLANAERCIYVADEHTRDTIASALRRSGVDVDRVTGTGQLMFWTRREYRQPGDFDLTTMRDFIQRTLAEALVDRCTGVRLAVEMTWTLNCGIGQEDLVRWEDVINSLSFPGSSISFLCQYNAGAFSQALAGMAVEVHPVVVVKDQVHRNIYYRPADQVLDHRSSRVGLDSLLRRLEQGRHAFPIDTRVLDLLPVAVCICEAPSGRIRYYNDQAVKLWSREPAWYDTDRRFCGAYRLYIDGKAIPMETCPMAVCVREAKSFRNVMAEFERPDGLRIDVLVNIAPIRDQQGRLIGAINVFQDITEQRRAEKEIHNLSTKLFERQERLRALATELTLAEQRGAPPPVDGVARLPGATARPRPPQAGPGPPRRGEPQSRRARQRAG